ncbi:agrin-like isoform X1, partial [Vespula squamosa]
PCEKTYCAWGATCVVSENGKALCQCPTNCPSNSAQVCGSDDVTYTNQCHLRQASCQKRKNTRIKHEGACVMPWQCATRPLGGSVATGEGLEWLRHGRVGVRKAVARNNSGDAPKADVALLAVITTGRRPLRLASLNFTKLWVDFRVKTTRTTSTYVRTDTRVARTSKQILRLRFEDRTAVAGWWTSS